MPQHDELTSPGARRRDGQPSPAGRAGRPPSSGAVDTPNNSDVAIRAGVAIGTVSNVLNHPEKVTEATPLKVEAAVQALSFVPNTAARNLRTGGNSLLGLVVVDLSSPFYIDVARGAESAAAGAGMHLLLANVTSIGADKMPISVSSRKCALPRCCSLR